MKPMDCPHCGEACNREEVDIEVGVIHGPWGCANCGWSENPEYDSRDGVRMDGEDRVFDQYGVSHHLTRLDGQVVLVGGNVAAPRATDRVMVSYPRDPACLESIITSWPCECHPPCPRKSEEPR